jgi:hypothetical protein
MRRAIGLAIAALAFAGCDPDSTPEPSASISPGGVLADHRASLSSADRAGISEQRLWDLRSQCSRSSSHSMAADWGSQHGKYDDCVRQAISGACAGTTASWDDYADCLTASGGNQMGGVWP